jgi:hypothetical protein
MGRRLIGPGVSAYDEESFGVILESPYLTNVLTETGTNGRIPTENGLLSRQTQ